MKRIIFCLLLTTSCQNVYKEFFIKSPNSDRIVSYRGEPTVIYSNRFQKDVSSYLRKGYGFIGSSKFNSSVRRNNDLELKEFAKELGAEVVLCNQSHSNAINGIMPYTYYTTSYLNGYDYNGTMTAYSQQPNTDYLPYSVQRYNYGAVFLGKLKDIGFGFLVRDLSDKERVKYHLKSGVYVAIIITNSPAYNSDLSEGDIIIKINGREVRDLSDFLSLDGNNVKRVKIEFLRDGEKKSTIIQS